MKKIKVVVLLIMISLSIHSASAASFKEAGLFSSKYNVLNGLDHYSPILSQYPFNEETINEIGFPHLYGNSKGPTQYTGEIPIGLSEKDELKGYFTSKSIQINGINRSWKIEENKIKVGSDDVHLRALETHPGVTLGPSGIGYTIISFFDNISRYPLDFLFMIKGIDMNVVLDSIDSSGEFKRSFKNMFLFNEDGNMSPILGFTLIAFTMSIALSMKKVISGARPFYALWNEFKYLLLALILVGVSYSDLGVTNLSKNGLNLITTFANEFVMDKDNSTGLYNYNTRNITIDANMSQYALIKKKDIESDIMTAFGVEMSELDLGKENFGVNEAQAIADTFAEPYTLDQLLEGLDDKQKSGYSKNDIYKSREDFIVSNGGTTVNNLGYFWYATNSLVKTTNISDSFGNRNYIESDPHSGILLIVDFLNHARKYAKENSEWEVVGRIDSIINSMVIPNYNRGMVLKLISVFVNIFLFLCLFTVSMFTLLGQVIVMLGPFLIPILVSMFLFPQTRRLGSDFVKTYCMSFFRVFIGLAIFNIVVSLVVTLSLQGTNGAFLAGILAFLLSRKLPNILEGMNRRLQRHESEFSRKFTGQFNNITNSMRRNNLSAKFNNRILDRLRRNKSDDKVASTKNMDSNNGNGKTKGDISGLNPVSRANENDNLEINKKNTDKNSEMLNEKDKLLDKNNDKEFTDNIEGKSQNTELNLDKNQNKGLELNSEVENSNIDRYKLSSSTESAVENKNNNRLREAKDSNRNRQLESSNKNKDIQQSSVKLDIQNIKSDINNLQNDSSSISQQNQNVINKGNISTSSNNVSSNIENKSSIDSTIANNNNNETNINRQDFINKNAHNKSKNSNNRKKIISKDIVSRN